jgi:hypothetical protein
MAFLDFVKEHSSRQQSQTPNVDKLPNNVKEQAVEAGRPAAQLMDRATAHRAQAPDASSSRGDSREALIRNQGDQGKEQAAMSPTDHAKSQTAIQQRSQGRSRGIER